MNSNFMDYFEPAAPPSGNPQGVADGLFSGNFDFRPDVDPSAYQGLLSNEQQLRLSHFATNPVRQSTQMNQPQPQQMQPMGNPRLQHYLNGHNDTSQSQPMYGMHGLQEMAQKNTHFPFPDNANQSLAYNRDPVGQWSQMGAGGASKPAPTLRSPQQQELPTGMMDLQDADDGLDLAYPPLVNKELPGMFHGVQATPDPNQANPQNIPYNLQNVAVSSPKFITRNAMSDPSPRQQCSPSFKPQFSPDSGSPSLPNMMNLTSQSPSGFNNSQSMNLGGFPSDFSGSPQQHTPLSPKLSHYGPYPNKNPFDIPNNQLMSKAPPSLMPSQMPGLGSPRGAQLLPSPSEQPMLSSPSPASSMNMFAMEQRPRFPMPATASRPPVLGPAARSSMVQGMQNNLPFQQSSQQSSYLLMQYQQLQQMIRQLREHPSPQAALQMQHLQAQLHRCYAEYNALQNQQLSQSMPGNQMQMPYGQSAMGMGGMLGKLPNAKPSPYGAANDMDFSLPGSLSMGGMFMAEQQMRLNSQVPPMQFPMDTKTKPRDRTSRSSSRSGSTSGGSRKKKPRTKSSDSLEISNSSPQTPATPIASQQAPPNLLGSVAISTPPSSMPAAVVSAVAAAVAASANAAAMSNQSLAAPIAQIAPLSQLAKMTPIPPNLSDLMLKTTAETTQYANVTTTSATSAVTSDVASSSEPLQMLSPHSMMDSNQFPLSVPSPALSDGQSEGSRRSLRERKKKNYKDDFDYNLSDEDEQKKGKEGLPTTGPHKLIAYKPSQAIEGEIAIVEKILATRTRISKIETEEKENSIVEYFVKYKGYSYLHCEWGTSAQIAKKDKRISMKIKRFRTKHDNIAYLTELDDEPFNPDFVEIDRVLDMSTCVDQVTGEPVTHYLIKWMSLPYEDSTWELQVNVEELKIQEYLQLKKPPPLNARRFVPIPEPMRWTKIERAPMYKNGNMLRNYQLEGLNWLRFCWFKRQNCILADEMGLGKTIQSISFLYDVKQCGVRGPFLVIAPLSTISNWQREFETWSDINAIVYHGSASSRQLIQQYEMYYFDEECEKIPGIFKFEAVITTYEMILNDNNVLNSIPWRCLVIDEAHRLKNRNCKLLEGLNNLRVEHSVLLTGTPLQNNVEELFSLLNFLDPTRFSSQVSFSVEFGNLKTESQVEKLQQILKPMMLRRLKEDVEKNIAPKEETIIEVELTTIQKKFYRAILEKNFSFLAKGTVLNSNLPNLMNTMMELRKCCNHPFLINGAEDRIVSEYLSESMDPGTKHYQAMIESSGKMVLIDKLLAKLKSGGHKVLIFSQMIKVLDLIEDYLIGRRYPYERIDGRVRGNIRQAAIDRFSRPDSDRFVFLLCTRAGGLGINLTAADTVIIFDSDWNPQNDLQAQARCHRIGQQKSVKVYRLVCRNTYEREMFDRASMKLGLDRAVLQNMNAKENPLQQQAAMSKKEIEDLLKKGAYGAIMDEDNADSSKFCEEDIDQILERRTQVVQIVTEGKGSSFAKASFVSEQARLDVDLADPDFWQKWAKKASIEVGDATQDRHLIINKPRQRKQTKRFGNEDGSVELSDIESEEEDQDAAPPRTAWTRVECFKVEKNLLTYGWGRWREIVLHGHFRQELNCREAEAISCSILIYCLHHFKGDEKTKGCIANIIKASIAKPRPVPEEKDETYAPSPGGKGKPKRAKKGAAKPPRKVQYSKPALVEANPDWKTMDLEALIIDAGYRKHLLHHCNKIILRVRLLHCLKEEIIGNHADAIVKGAYIADIPLVNLPFDGDVPAVWWDKEADKSLLVGVFKHGYEKYHQIKTDPCLTFSVRFANSHPDEPQPAPSPYGSDLMSMERCEDSNDPVDAKKRKRNNDDEDFNSDDASTKGEDDFKDMIAMAASPAPSAKDFALLPKQDLSSSEWPSVSDANTRLRRIVFGYLRGCEKEQQKIMLLEKEKEKKEKKEKMAQQVREKQLKKAEMAQKWSRREETDFYRVASSFGVVYDQTTKAYEWTKFRQLARLDKKDDDRLTNYFKDFMAMCRRVCHQATDEDLRNFNVSRVESITEERANRCLQRVQLLRTIREKVLPHKQLNERMKLCQPSAEFPPWWKPGVHDKDLLVGVSRHGIGRTDYHLFTDPDMSFKAVLDAACKRKNNHDAAQESAETVATQDKSDGHQEANTKNKQDDFSTSGTPPASSAPDTPRTATPTADHADDLSASKSVALPPSITPEAAEMLSLWPKDRVIITRLQKICHCVMNGYWHKGGKLESIVSKLQPQLLHVQPPTLCRSVTQGDRKGLITEVQECTSGADAKIRGDEAAAMPKDLKNATFDDAKAPPKKQRKRKKKETVDDFDSPVANMVVSKPTVPNDLSQKLLNKIMKNSNSKPMAVVSPTIDTTKPKREKRKRKATPVHVRTAIVPLAVQLDSTAELEVKQVASESTQEAKKSMDVVHIPHVPAERHHHFHHHHHHHHCTTGTTPAVIHVPQIKKQKPASPMTTGPSQLKRDSTETSPKNSFPWPRQSATSHKLSPKDSESNLDTKPLNIPVVTKPESISSILPYPVSRTEKKPAAVKPPLSAEKRSGVERSSPHPASPVVQQTPSPVSAQK